MIDYVFDKKMSKYLLVSTTGLLLDISVMYTLYYIFDLSKVLSIFIGFTSSNIYKYFLNYYFTFKINDDGFKLVRFLKYWFFVLIGDGIGIISILLIDNIFNDLLVSKVFSLIVSFLYGYYVSNKYIYKS